MRDRIPQRGEQVRQEKKWYTCVSVPHPLRPGGSMSGEMASVARWSNGSTGTTNERPAPSRSRQYLSRDT
jgi:hypothetical protein